MQDEIIGYFGYGSLVNRATLRTSYAGLRKARLNGWRRHWQSRGIETAPLLPANGNAAEQVNLALLSIHRHRETSIDGMLVLDRAEHLHHVDEREARYQRVEIRPEDLELIGAEDGEIFPQRLYVYVAQESEPSGQAEHLLQSYLDAVMSGFHEAHGEEGLERFFETTTGFDRPIHCDRHAPLYPRAVQVTPELARLFDERLKASGVRFP